MTRQKRWLFFAPLLISGCVHAERFEDDDDRRMAMIERIVTLPAQAEPLRRYQRHYAWSRDDPETVQAIYIVGGKPGQFWLDIDELPIVFDGGCGVIRIRFHMPTRRVTHMACS